MSDVVDGSFDTPEGRKVFVQRRSDEPSEDFAVRAMRMLMASDDGRVLDRVLVSEPSEWEILPTDRWLEVENRTDPRLRLRLTTLESNDGGSVGHLVVDCDDHQVADSWGDEQEGAVFLPRAEDGRIRNWQAALWRLVHEIKGLGIEYDSCFKRSGIVVE